MIHKQNNELTVLVERLITGHNIVAYKIYDTSDTAASSLTVSDISTEIVECLPVTDVDIAVRNSKITALNRTKFFDGSLKIVDSGSGATTFSNPLPETFDPVTGII